MPHIPKVTRALLAVYIVFALGRPVLGSWLRVADVLEWLALVPGDVLRGQVWRLFTHPFFSRPWLQSEALGFLWSGFILFFVGRALESAWGTRLMARRVALLVAMPAVLTCLLSLAVGRLQSAPFYGLSPLLAGMFVAFGTTLRGRQVQIFPLPMAVGGDQLIAFGGVFLLVEILMQGAILPFIPDVLAFAFALAWFRFDVARDLRRSWLNYRKGQLETKVQKLRRDRNLRVVRNDEDDDSNRYLH